MTTPCFVGPGQAVRQGHRVFGSAVQDEHGKIRLKFDHAAGGLATRDGKAPSDLEIAGCDKVFHPATAMIEGDELVVVSEKVAAPREVRYAFTTEATPNLMDKAGLPASSFRTDSW